MGRETGFTLIELLVAAALAAVLAALAAPGFANLLDDAERDGHVLDLVSDLSYARSEAIIRRRHVTVCPSRDGMDCNGDAHWETGWIVFVDPNSNGHVDAGEHILRVDDASGQDTIRGSKHRITYQGSGYSLGFMDSIRVCDDRGTAWARSIVINMPGRVRVTHGARACP